MRSIFAGLKCLAFMVHVLLIFIIQTPLLWVHRGKYSYVYPLFFHKLAMKIFGIKIEVIGQQDRSKQTLYVCNHISYMDINAIGSVIKEASFIAKKEVSMMPVYGYLSTMQQTAYVSRDRKDALKDKNALENMVLEGRNLILFPEGTTTDGTHVLPFKSSLFGIVLKDEVKDSMQVQPITLSLLEVDGKKPITKERRNQYVWTTEMDDNLSAHLWQFARGSGAKLRIEFHAPMDVTAFENRKDLAQKSFEIVQKHLWLAEQEEMLSKEGVDSGAQAA